MVKCKKKRSTLAVLKSWLNFFLPKYFKIQMLLATPFILVLFLAIEAFINDRIILYGSEPSLNNFQSILGIYIKNYLQNPFSRP